MAKEPKAEGNGAFKLLSCIIIFLLSSSLSLSTLLYQTALAIINTSINHKPVSENMNITTIDDAAVPFVLKGTDVDEGDRLNFTIVAKPAYGNISSFDPSSGAGVYTPFPAGEAITGYNYFLSEIGSDGFGYAVTDENGTASNAATVTIRSIPAE